MVAAADAALLDGGDSRGLTSRQPGDTVDRVAVTFRRGGARVHTAASAFERMEQIAIITGGSRGIGAATARLAAERRYTVCVNYHHNRTAAEAVVGAIQRAGGRALAVAADVAVESDVIRLFETVDKELGAVTALVNNAGILERQMRVEDMDAARLNRIFATNVIGSFLCAREAVRRMSTTRGGSGGAIVNVSSGASRLGSPGEYVDYAASKGAIDTMTIGLAKEVATEGVRVNAVRAGFIYTDIHASGGEPDRVERVKESVPMRRGGHALEVAHAILWLLSDAASYSTGTFIDVTGGK
jgi:NAD(P)-dependent dehydrogenase (short-subunit alcohol dehydrogenase family)